VCGGLPGENSDQPWSCPDNLRPEVEGPTDDLGRALERLRVGELAVSLVRVEDGVRSCGAGRRGTKSIRFAAGRNTSCQRANRPTTTARPRRAGVGGAVIGAAGVGASVFCWSLVRVSVRCGERPGDPTEVGRERRVVENRRRTLRRNRGCRVRPTSCTRRTRVAHPARRVAATGTRERAARTGPGGCDSGTAAGRCPRSSRGAWSSARAASRLATCRTDATTAKCVNRSVPAGGRSASAASSRGSSSGLIPIRCCSWKWVGYNWKRSCSGGTVRRPRRCRLCGGSATAGLPRVPGRSRPIP